MAIESIQPLADETAERNEMPLALGEGRDRLRVGQELPARLKATDMMRIFEIGPTRFYSLVRAHKFDRFELPHIGVRAWSGAKVQRYLEGEAPVAARNFGRRAR